MNYDSKPYVPVLSPPGQYNAHISSPNAANLPTSYHLIPVKCSQGMMQAAHSSQHKQMFYSNTPPPPWVCNFQPPPPAPTVAAIPFVDGQAMIPGCSPPKFYLPLVQDNRKFESQTGSLHTPKVRKLETDFKLAALRNGIRVEESPKTGKPFPTASSTTRASVDTEGPVGNVLNNAPQALERNFHHARLSSEGLCAAENRKRLDSTNTTTMPLDGESPEPTKWDSKIAINIKAAAENHGNKSGGANSNPVEPPNEDLVEEFVLNVILCAVNSLMQERGHQANGGLMKYLSQEDLGLRGNGDDQEDEKLVGKATDLLIEFKVDNDGTTSELKTVREDDKEAKKADLLPNPDAGMTNLDKGMAQPSESMPTPEKVMPNPDKALLNPDKAMPNPDKAMLNPDEAMLNPDEAMLNPDEALPNPDKAMLNPDAGIFNPNESLPNPDEAISNANESMPNPSRAKSDPTVLVKEQDKVIPISTEKVAILSQPMAYMDGEIPSNNLYEPACAEEDEKSPEDQEVEELFVRLALQKGIKVGGISPARTNDEELGSILESPGKDNNIYQEDAEAEDLFVKRALQKGIKVGRMSPTNTGSLQESFMKGKNQDQDIEDLFVRLALRKGIKVGNMSPVNDTIPQHNIMMDVTMGEEFENRALRNGIRLGTSHISSNGNTSPTLAQVMPEPLAVDWLYSVNVNSAPPLASYTGKRFPTLVKFDSAGQGNLDWVGKNEPGYRNNTSLGKDSFEELAKRNGIRVGETLKPKVDSQTQTENSFNSQETQTVGLIQVGNASTQVDVTKEAFKNEFDEWMQDELSIIDSKASSFRVLFLQEEEARNEAERRLAVEMDENVKAKRNTKMLIDKLKEQLDEKQETIDKLNKELKSLKKQKDNELKRLTKELKRKDEDLRTVSQDNTLKEVVIESMRDIAKEQSELMEKMEERLKTMEREMENERQKSDSLVKVVASKDTTLQTKRTDEWQVVKGRHHAGTRAAMKPKPTRQYYQLDGLLGFDEREYEKYNKRPSLETPISEEIQPRESLTGKNEGCVTTTQDVALNVCATNDDGMALVSGDSVPSLPKEPSLASGCTLGPPLPPPGIYMPSVCTSNIPSSKSVGTDNSTFSTTSVLNPNRLYIPSDAHGVTGGLPGPTSGSTSIALPIPTGVPKQVIPGGPYNVSLVNDATMPTSVVTNQDLPRAPYPTPGGTGSASLLPSGVLQQVLQGGTYSISIGANEKIPNPSPPSSCDTPTLPPGIIVDPALRQPQPIPSSKSKTTNKFSSFDKLMEALRDSYPDHSRPSLMVYLKKAKEAFGSSGFKGKQISEIVDKVAQVIDQE